MWDFVPPPGLSPHSFLPTPFQGLALRRSAGREWGGQETGLHCIFKGAVRAACSLPFTPKTIMIATPKGSEGCIVPLLPPKRCIILLLCKHAKQSGVSLDDHQRRERERERDRTKTRRRRRTEGDGCPSGICGITHSTHNISLTDVPLNNCSAAVGRAPNWTGHTLNSS